MQKHTVPMNTFSAGSAIWKTATKKKKKKKRRRRLKRKEFKAAVRRLALFVGFQSRAVAVVVYDLKSSLSPLIFFLGKWRSIRRAFG